LPSLLPPLFSSHCSHDLGFECVLTHSEHLDDGGQPQASNLCSGKVAGTEVGAGKARQLEPEHRPCRGQVAVQEGVLTSKLVQLMECSRKTRLVRWRGSHAMWHWFGNPEP
jgi:hypothetical protein